MSAVSVLSLSDDYVYSDVLVKLSEDLHYALFGIENINLHMEPEVSGFPGN
jgi:hypothetical protein